MTVKADVDDLLLQRLVDGELSDEDRSGVLASLDARPQLWRTVALAFVEDQLWSGALRRHAARDERPSEPARATRTGPASRRAWGAMVAVAASLLAMLGLGYQVGRHQELRPRIAQSGGDLRHGQLAADQTVDASMAPAAPAAPCRVQLVYRGGEQEQSLELPVYDASELPGAFWQGPDAASVEDLNRELADQGYRVDWNIEYLSRNLDGGKCLLVPLQTVAIQHRGQ